MVRVEPAPDGAWQVVAADGAVLATAPTNAQAWRIADRLNNEAHNRKEAAQQWSALERLKEWP